MGQRHQLHLAGAGRAVQAPDDAYQPLHVAGPVGEDQGAGLGIAGQVAVGRDQGAQDRHQALRAHVLQVDDAGHDVVGAGLPPRGERAAQLAFLLRHDLGDAVGVHGGEAVDLQHGLEHPVGFLFGQRPRGHHGDLALDVRVHQEVPAGELRHGLDDGTQLGVLEIEVDVLGKAGGGHGQQERAQAQAAQQGENGP